MRLGVRRGSSSLVSLGCSVLVVDFKTWSMLTFSTRGYASYGNNVSAAYCDGDLLGYIYDQPNGNLIFQCNFGPNYSPTIAQGPGYKLCRCIPSKAEYYGASSLAATPIAGVIPIQTRVATLGSSSGAMAAVSSPFSLGGCLLTASLALTLGTWLH